MSVNDDAIALKGGKGPKADLDPNNGENRNILIEDNTFGFCHSVLTCGSESIHNYNIIIALLKHILKLYLYFYKRINFLYLSRHMRQYLLRIILQSTKNLLILGWFLVFQ